MALAFADRFRAKRTPLLTEEYVVHIDVAGAGWAEGVVDCPCLNVEVPYTPMGYDTALDETNCERTVSFPPLHYLPDSGQRHRHHSRKACSTRIP